MTLQEAQQLLDMAKAGAPVPTEVVTWALTVTGDAMQRNWATWQDIGEFVTALRKAGAI